MEDLRRDVSYGPETFRRDVGGVVGRLEGRGVWVWEDVDEVGVGDDRVEEDQAGYRGWVGLCVEPGERTADRVADED